MSTATAQETPPARVARADRSSTKDVLREKGVYIAFIILILYNVVATAHFTNVEQLTTLALQTGAAIIVSLGMLLVIGTGGIDLSVGATMAIAGAVLGKVLAKSSTVSFGQLTVALLIAMLAGLAVGAFNGFIIANTGVQPIVATLSLLVAGRGLAEQLTKGGLVELFAPGLNTLGNKGIKIGVEIPYLFIVAVAITAIVFVIARRTTFGFRILAIGGNQRAARLSGLPVKRTTIMVYAVSGLLAAVAGIILSARSAAADPNNAGLQMELVAITAVVVGGTPLIGGRMKVVATVFAALLMQLLNTTLLSHNIKQSETSMITAVIIILAVYIQRNAGRNT